MKLFVDPDLNMSIVKLKKLEPKKPDRGHLRCDPATRNSSRFGRLSVLFGRIYGESGKFLNSKKVIIELGGHVLAMGTS